MPHDVFICHARKDEVFASAICEKLESAHLRCWIAVRDISPNDDWIEATRNAIGSSRVMVLVLSENANAAAHIEREIAHAFYTGCIIAPLRVSDTLPRRDFLFYLGNVRSFDAFGLPPEQPLDVFIATINEVIGSRVAGRSARAARNAAEPAYRFNSLDSPVGGRWAGESRNLGLWKCLAISASLFATVWFLSSVSWGPKIGALPADADRQVIFSDSSTSRDSATHAPADGLAKFSSEAPTFANRNVASSDQQETADPSAPPVLQPPIATSSPQSAVDQTGAGEAKALPAGDSQRPVEGYSAGTADRHDGQRRKLRKAHHHLRVRPWEESFIAHIKSGFTAVWRQLVTRTKDTGNR